jgi:hypothetical protein
MTNLQNDNSQNRGHEPIAVSTRAVSVGMGVLFGGVIVSLLLVAGLFYLLTARRGGQATNVLPAPVDSPPGIPPLDADQRRSLRHLRDRENKLLTEYSWADREAGIARIPVERAMEILSAPSNPGRQPQDDASDE